MQAVQPPAPPTTPPTAPPPPVQGRDPAQDLPAGAAGDRGARPSGTALRAGQGAGLEIQVGSVEGLRTNPTELNLPPLNLEILLKCVSGAARNLRFPNFWAHAHMGCISFTSFLWNSCNFQYFILGWPTLVLGPSVSVIAASLEPRPSSPRFYISKAAR